MISICIGTLDRPESFYNLLNSIIRHTKIDWELVVADAGIEKPLDVSKLPSNVKVIPERPRLGPAKGYNIAFRHCKGDYVVWLNDDAVVLENWDIEAVGFMQRNPWVGIGALYWVNEGWGSMKIDFWCGLPYANFGIIEREFGNIIGWFDEEIFMYGNDNSICFKSLLAGKPVIGIEKSRILHRPYMDKYRPGNEAHQPDDARILLNKYELFMDEMRKTYEKFKNYPIK